VQSRPHTFASESRNGDLSVIDVAGRRVGRALNATARTGEQRIAAAFAAARRDGRRAALMPFLMGGFPSLHASREIGAAYADGGADLVEVGIPSSDAVADGPVIRAAGAASLRARATVDGVLDVARTVSAHVPVVVMCYANIVLARGAQPFADALRHAGASGLIVPDLPPEESPALLDACDAAGVALVPLIAPATPDGRVVAIAAWARGFVYTVSVTGTTGERAALTDGAASLVRRVKAQSAVPTALGFGISTPEHAVQARPPARTASSSAAASYAPRRRPSTRPPRYAGW
jgi:tryptophan synthase alpha chain